MFAPTNPEIERRRAESILRSFTEYEEAVNLFAPSAQDAPSSDQNETADFAAEANRQSILRVFKSVMLNHQLTVDEPQPAYGLQQNSSCCA